MEKFESSLFFVDMFLFLFFFICFQLISTGLFTEQDFWDTSASKEVEEEVER